MERSAPIVRAMPPLSGAHELTPNALPLAPAAPRRIHVRAGLHLAQRRGRPAPVSPPQTAFLLCSVSALAAFSHRRRCAFRAWITARMDEEAVRACMIGILYVADANVPQADPNLPLESVARVFPERAHNVHF